MTDQVRLSQIFDLVSGNKLDKNKLFESKDGVNLISRSSKNLGIVGKYHRITSIEPFPAGLITVALGGSVLSSFVQPEPFYTSQNIAVLIPKTNMPTNVRHYYCQAISSQYFRYSTHGREANTSLQDLMVPNLEGIPIWVSESDIENYLKVQKAKLSVSLNCGAPPFKLDVSKWEILKIGKLFDVTMPQDGTMRGYSEFGQTPFVSSTAMNNGISKYVNAEPTNPANTITANRGGSVGWFFYHELPYLASSADIRVLLPRFEMTKALGIFFVTLMNQHRFRFSYTRKMGSQRLKELEIPVPTKSGSIDRQYIEAFMTRLRFSGSIL